MFSTYRLFLERVGHFLTQSDYRLGFINIIFILLLFIAPSDKAIFIISTIHLFTMLLASRSAIEALVHLYWPWFVFEFGRDFSAILIPLEHIRSETYQSPITSTIVFSPINLLVALLICILVVKFFQNPGLLIKKVFNNKLLLIALVYFLITLVSSVLTDYHILFSLLQSLKFSTNLIWLLAVLQISDSQLASFYKNLASTFMVLLVLELSLALVQLVSGGFIGIHSEKAWYIASFGKGVDESSDLIRVSGFQYHPNAMANWLFSLTISIAILLKLVRKKISDSKTSIFLFLGVLLVSVVSLTRTVIGAGILVLFVYKKEAKDRIAWFLSKLRNLSQRNRSLAALIVLLLCVFTYVRIKDRILLTLYSTQATGGIATRFQQYEEAIELIGNKPLFGHGTGMYQAALYHIIPDGEVRYFPERVHNTFLLILAESGIFAFIFAVLFILTFIQKGYQYLDKKILLVWSVYGIVYLFLQPVSQDLFSVPMVLTTMLVAHYEKNKYSKTH